MIEYGRRKVRLGDALVKDGMISEEQLQKALELQKGSGRKLGETLIDAGMVTEENIASVLSKQLGYASIDLQNISISKDVLDLVTPSVLKKNRVIPIEYAPDNMNILRVAMADPLDLDAMDDISIITGCQVEPLVSTPRSVMLAIDRFYGQAEVATALEDYARERLIVEEEDTYSEDINNSPIVILVKEMIEKAARQRASDIHIEPLEKKVRVRYRIDGALYEKGRYDIRILSAMVARIKIIGGMDISEKRKPQDVESHRL